MSGDPQERPPRDPRRIAARRGRLLFRAAVVAGLAASAATAPMFWRTWRRVSQREELPEPVGAALLGLVWVLPLAFGFLLGRWLAGELSFRALVGSLSESQARKVGKAPDPGPWNRRARLAQDVLLALGLLFGVTFFFATWQRNAAAATGVLLYSPLPAGALWAGRRWVETRGRLGAVREVLLPPLEKVLEECLELCRTGKTAKTRVRRARLGRQELERIEELFPGARSDARRLARYFAAVEACAEIDEAFAKAVAARSTWAGRRNAEKARGLARERGVGDAELALSGATDPRTGKPLRLADVTALLPLDETGEEGGDATEPARRSSAPGRWVPEGARVAVQGRSIVGGLFYLGGVLPPVVPFGDGSDEVEPALVDPELPVDPARSDRKGADLAEEPRYGELAPAERTAYLDWLASGRADPRTAAGYAWLFLYGLERRLLHDGERSPLEAGELAALSNALEGLLATYGSDAELAEQVAELLGLVELRRYELGAVDAVREETDDGESALPFALRLELGRLARAGRPLPVGRALAWLEASPEVRWRTPATRCPEVFRELFQLRYRQRFGEGPPLEAGKARLGLDYAPANPSFGGASHRVETELPDVSAARAPFEELARLVESCCDELDAYSRLCGRSSGEPSGLAAAAVLPADLESALKHPEVRALADRVEGLLGDAPERCVRARELVGPWPSARPDRLTRAESVQLAQVLARLGIGMEPDVRFGGPALKAAGSAALFRLGAEASAAPSEGFATASLVLQLAASVATAGGEVRPDEERALEEHLAVSLALDDDEHRRLRAHLAWLLADPPGRAGVRRRVAELDDAAREGIGRFLVSVACADGRADPNEVKILTGLYRLLGLDEAGLHSAIHQASIAGDALAVAEPEPAPGGRAAERLDRRAIAAKVAETQAVARLLAGIFEEPEPEPEPVSRPIPTPAAAVPERPPIDGLDLAHSELLRAAAERDSWSRPEFEALSSRFGLLPDGALETLNELALERSGDLVADGEDPIAVDRTVIEELLS